MCEVCGKPAPDWKKLPAHLQEQVYRPNHGESYDVEVDLADPEGFGE